MKTNQVGVDLIKQFEGLVDGDPKTPGLDPYICPTGFVTIGYGHVIRDGKTPLKGRASLPRAAQIQKAITPEEAEDLLVDDLSIYEAEVTRRTAGIALNDNQFSALVSFVFNVGGPNFTSSTMRKLMVAGDMAGAANEFAKWVKGDTNGDGKLETLPGLVRRREAERQLFLKEMKPLTQSRTLQGSVAALAATGGGIVADATTQFQGLQASLASVGIELAYVRYALAALAIASLVFAIYARVNDRLTKGH